MLQLVLAPHRKDWSVASQTGLGNRAKFRTSRQSSRVCAELGGNVNAGEKWRLGYAPSTRTQASDEISPQPSKSHHVDIGCAPRDRDAPIQIVSTFDVLLRPQHVSGNTTPTSHHPPKSGDTRSYYDHGNGRGPTTTPATVYRATANPWMSGSGSISSALYTALMSTGRAHHYSPPITPRSMYGDIHISNYPDARQFGGATADLPIR